MLPTLLRDGRGEAISGSAVSPLLFPSLDSGLRRSDGLVHMSLCCIPNLLSLVGDIRITLVAAGKSPLSAGEG